MVYVVKHSALVEMHDRQREEQAINQARHQLRRRYILRGNAAARAAELDELRDTVRRGLRKWS